MPIVLEGTPAISLLYISVFLLWLFPVFIFLCFNVWMSWSSVCSILDQTKNQKPSLVLSFIVWQTVLAVLSHCLSISVLSTVTRCPHQPAFTSLIGTCVEYSTYFHASLSCLWAQQHWGTLNAFWRYLAPLLPSTLASTPQFLIAMCIFFSPTWYVPFYLPIPLILQMQAQAEGLLIIEIRLGLQL